MKILQILLALLLSSIICNGQVFTAGKKFIYEAQYFQSEKKIAIKEIVIFSVSGQNWTQSKDQKEAIWKYVTKKKTQTILKNQFSLGWTAIDTTGMIESEQKTWIHPPRHNQYTMNEIAPFPDVRKKYNIGDSYQSILFIGNGFGLWSGKKSKNIYTIAVIDIMESDTIWTINSKSEIEGKTNILIIKFSGKRGFISLDYSFYNGDKESLILKE
jgi:hypothetical protein